MLSRRYIKFALVCVAGVATCAAAEDRFFELNIRPVLAERC
ncbi:MAG: hypothetical protein O3B01_30070 [Planctomycetota bacterium]|nr:hypothetical protein [Planctomycetota bacterium]